MMWSCTAMPRGACDIDDVPGDLHIGGGGGRVSAGMIVHQDQSRGGQFQRPFDHLARIDRRVVDGARLLHLVGDERVALVEEEQAELFLVHECHGGAAIIDHRTPGREHRTFRHRAAGEAAGRSLDDLQVGDDAFAKALDLHQARRGGGEHLREGAEAPHQFLGEGLHVAAGDRPEQDEFQKLIIRHRVAADIRKPRAQPVPVPVVMGCVVAAAHAGA